ncbi:T9SS type A sorting domain-containing protein [Flammeovirga pectinis]|uniref:T9SS type A sorting domain-containing protein n=1 Tax=Flammeovirga pectinis TaxID=2494373 RepID=A0A3Q9FT09_9BACT|nr:T9SS type A sorting domain-containing protein [Flammeovirga pectinis]AZQ63775.1 T9SS type A sorting domain-containing protein [Flammeovirga pectinis]
MKKIFIVLVYLTCASASVAQIDTSNYTTELLSSANYLVGTPYEVMEDGMVSSINIIGNSKGTKVRMAIYSDVDNAPDELIAVSEVNKLGKGLTSVAIEPIALEAGNYWIMAIYKSTGKHLLGNTKDVNSDVFYAAVDFESELPLNAQNFENYQGHAFPFFLDFKIEEKETSLAIYPNPTVDFVKIEHHIENYEVRIFDLTGVEIKAIHSDSKTLEVDLSGLQKGHYLFKIGEQKAQYVIKK